MVSVL
jgi:hypothetical protein